jgi:hypothetical protein
MLMASTTTRMQLSIMDGVHVDGCGSWVQRGWCGVTGSGRREEREGTRRDIFTSREEEHRWGAVKQGP